MTTWNKAFNFSAYFLFLIYEAMIEFTWFLITLEMFIDKFFSVINYFSLNGRDSDIVLITFSFQQVTAYICAL